MFCKKKQQKQKKKHCSNIMLLMRKMSIWNKEEKLVDGKVIREGKTILLRRYRVRKQTPEQTTEEAVVGRR